MARQVKKLYEPGIADASFIGLDFAPVAANTKQINPKADPDCALGVHFTSNQHDERRLVFYRGYKNHVLADCISGLPLYELTPLPMRGILRLFSKYSPPTIPFPFGSALLG